MIDEGEALSKTPSMKYLLGLLLLFSPVIYADSETHEFQSQGLEGILIKNTSGNIRIKTTTQAQTIVVASKKTFSNACQMNLQRTGSQIIIEVSKKNPSMKNIFSPSDCTVDFDIQAPQQVNVDLNSGSGNLNLSGTRGTLRFQIGSGEVNAEGSFKAIMGRSGSGNIKITGLNRDVEMRTGSGNIQMNYPEAPQKGTIHLRAGSGNIELLFPKGTSLKTDFERGSGKLRNELGESSDASFQVSVRTGSGNLTIRAARP